MLYRTVYSVTHNIRCGPAPYDATLAAPTPNAPIDVSRRSPQSKKDRVFLVQQVGRAGGESCFGCGYVVQVYRPKRAAWPSY